MCGVFAFFLKRSLNDQDLELARCAVKEIAHRGPDGSGEWFDRAKGVYLGHTRLSIIDISHASDQPIVRDRHAFVFNGEIYNYQDLKRDLVKGGTQFSSQGDGEVLFRALETWGEGALDRVDGMFALIDWDGESARLAVDSFGEKPLFTAETAEGVYVCSEIAPLVKALNLQPSIGESDWCAYLSLGFLPQPTTFYKEIEMLPPGTLRYVRSGNLGSIKKYYDLPSPIVATGAPEPITDAAIDDLAEALTESLERRLIADVPLTLFLSAGVDSSLIAALCRFELGHKPECLTVSFNNVKGMRDEAPVASQIAEFLGFEHRVVDHQNEGVSIEQIVELLAQPNGTVGALPLKQISSIARNAGYKVALSGIGGDEVTSGYAKHAYVWNIRNIYKIPQMVRSVLGQGLRVSKKTSGIATLLRTTQEELYVTVKNYPALDGLRQIPGFQHWVENEFSKCSAPEIAIPRYELDTVMPAVHLLISDHASMRHGLELRTPFLNRKVVDVVSKWDPRSLVAFGQKQVLRSLLNRYLPEKLTSQPKTGFSYPKSKLLERPSPTFLPGLPDQLVEGYWNKRFAGGGWHNLAVRVSAADIFFNAKKVTPSD